jgi:hypothetical protein
MAVGECVERHNLILATPEAAAELGKRHAVQSISLQAEKTRVPHGHQLSERPRSADEGFRFIKALLSLWGCYGQPFSDYCSAFCRLDAPPAMSSFRPRTGGISHNSCDAASYQSNLGSL